MIHVLDTNSEPNSYGEVILNCGEKAIFNPTSLSSLDKDDKEKVCEIYLSEHNKRPGIYFSYIAVPVPVQAVKS
jgi:hypothetical protein